MRVALVDDNELMRESLERALTSRGIEVVWRPDDSAHIDDLLRSSRARAPSLDAAVLDLKLPPTYSDEGIRLARALRATNPALGVIILSAYEKELRLTFARRALSEVPGHGGVGYLFKDRITRDLLRDAVFRVSAGGTIVDPEFAAEAIEHGRQSFSPSEIDVLELMTRGHTNAEIASALHLAVVTVEKRVSAVHRKLVQDTPPTDAGDGVEKNRRVVTVIEWLRRQGRLD